MTISGLLRTVIGTCGLFVLTWWVGGGAPPPDDRVEPAVAIQTAADFLSPPIEAPNCRYKPLSGSHIKVQVCTSKDGAEYRMDRRARTNAVVVVGTGAAPIAAPLPQVQ
jgi:hypothetical protein